MVSDGGLTVRHADVDADGAHMDGTNGTDAAGVKGEGVDVDGANGGSGGRGVNVDGARGVGTRSANAN